MKLQFEVTGMTCAACSARVEKVTRGVPGVEKADVNLLAGTMQVEAQSEAVVPAIEKAVQDAGRQYSSGGFASSYRQHPAPTKYEHCQKRFSACRHQHYGRESGPAECCCLTKID